MGAEVASGKEDIVAVDMQLSRRVEGKRVDMYEVYSSKRRTEGWGVVVNCGGECEASRLFWLRTRQRTLGKGDDHLTPPNATQPCRYGIVLKQVFISEREFYSLISGPDHKSMLIFGLPFRQFYRHWAQGEMSYAN